MRLVFALCRVQKNKNGVSSLTNRRFIFANRRFVFLKRRFFGVKFHILIISLLY